jgi:DNA polymerase-3 subunit delta'
MNLEASNALLKTLEEPPKNTHIVLTAPETSDLLDTIVSRCQHILFRPIPAEMIVETLQARRDMDKDTASTIAVLTHGSLGRALSCDAEQWMAWRREVIGRLRSLSSAPIPSLFDFAEHLSRDTERLNDALDLIRLWFRDILISKYCRNHLLNRDYLGDIEREAERLSAEDLLETIQVVSRTQDSISRNANRRLALDVMMLHLKAAGDARLLRRAAA